MIAGQSKVYWFKIWASVVLRSAACHALGPVLVWFVACIALDRPLFHEGLEEIVIDLVYWPIGLLIGTLVFFVLNLRMLVQNSPDGHKTRKWVAAIIFLVTVVTSLLGDLATFFWLMPWPDSQTGLVDQVAFFGSNWAIGGVLAGLLPGFLLVLMLILCARPRQIVG